MVFTGTTVGAEVEEAKVEEEEEEEDLVVSILLVMLGVVGGVLVGITAANQNMFTAFNNSTHLVHISHSHISLQLHIARGACHSKSSVPEEPAKIDSSYIRIPPNFSIKILL